MAQEENITIDQTIIDTIVLEKNVSLYKDGFRLLPYTTNIPSAAFSMMVDALQTYFEQTIQITSNETQYTIDYNIANNYDISFESNSNAIIQLNVINIPIHKSINVRINNTAGNTIMFNTKEIITNNETGIYNIVFKNPNTQIVLFGNKIQQFK